MDDISYTYTAHRSSYLMLVGSLGFVLLLEGGCVALLVAVLVHNFWLALAIDLGHGALCVWIFYTMLATLWTRHCLTETHLVLHYGALFKAHIPCEMITVVQPIVGPAVVPQSVGVRYNAKKQTLSLCFSAQGQLLLRLNEPLLLQVGRKSCRTWQIEFNVDQADALLEALSARKVVDPQVTSEIPSALNIG